MSDFTDGQYFKSHPVFTLYKDGLQIFFYFDDLEVCNPLGSKRKIHKLSKCILTMISANDQYKLML